MLGMKNHLDISDSIEIQEVDSGSRLYLHASYWESPVYNAVWPTWTEHEEAQSFSLNHGGEPHDHSTLFACWMAAAIMANWSIKHLLFRHYG